MAASRRSMIATVARHLASSGAAAEGEDPEPHSMTAAEFDECIDFLDLVFAGNGGGHASGGGFAKLLPQLYQPEKMHWQQAIRVGPQLLAVVGVFPRTLRVLDTTLSVGGIGGVATHQRLSRGSGHMRRLMHHCVEKMRDDGCHLAILGGQRQRCARVPIPPAPQPPTRPVSWPR